MCRVFHKANKKQYLGDLLGLIAVQPRDELHLGLRVKK